MMRLTVRILVALVFYESQFSVIKVSLLFDGLYVVQEKFVVAQLLSKVIFKLGDYSIDLLHTFVCHQIGVLHLVL